MTASHQTILAELYEIDPTLRDHEAELVPLIRKLLAHDPAQKPSPAFVKKLRTELRAATLSGVEYRMQGTTSFLSVFQRFAFAAAGATLAVLIAVPVTLQLADDSALPPATDPYDNGETAMKAGEPTSVENANGPVPLPLTGGMYARPQSGGGGGGDMSMIAPWWNPVKFTLAGDLPELPTGKIPLLQRRSVTSSVAFDSVRDAFDDVPVDLGSFRGLTVDNVHASQHTAFGYTVDVSPADGSVSINQAWDEWPHPENDCRDEACFLKLRPKPGDVPSDAELIRLANAFVDEHGIDLSGHGDPVVNGSWRRSYDATPDKSMAYVPEDVAVVYPLLVDGTTVTEQNGDPAGIMIQVSVRHKRVSAAWGIMRDVFEDAAPRAAVSDKAEIDAFLAQAGSQEPNAPVVTLRNPTKVIVRMYFYENNESLELYVPALAFDVTDIPADVGYVQPRMVIPLVKDFLTTPPQPGMAAAEKSY